MYKFFRSITFARRSSIIDKWGELPHPPLRQIILVEELTGELFSTTDLAQKKYRRNKKLEKLYRFYADYFLSRQVSIALNIVNVKSISSVSNQIKMYKRKFRKKQIQLLAYYWQRDIGENDFEPHYHIILILSRIGEGRFSDIFLKYKKIENKIELCNSLKDFTGYLKKKEFFAPYGKRNNSLSKNMLKPT